MSEDAQNSLFAWLFVASLPLVVLGCEVMGRWLELSDSTARIPAIAWIVCAFAIAQRRLKRQAAKSVPPAP